MMFRFYVRDPVTKSQYQRRYPVSIEFRHFVTDRKLSRIIDALHRVAAPWADLRPLPYDTNLLRRRRTFRCPAESHPCADTPSRMPCPRNDSAIHSTKPGWDNNLEVVSLAHRTVDVVTDLYVLATPPAGVQKNGCHPEKPASNFRAKGKTNHVSSPRRARRRRPDIRAIRCCGRAEQHPLGGTPVSEASPVLVPCFD